MTKDENGYTYQYDYENRITEIYSGTTHIASYQYDALSRRIKKTDHITPANTRHYYYNDNWQVLAEYDATATTQTAKYLYGNYIDETLMMIQPQSTGSPDIYYYLHNHLFSPIVLLNDSGSIAERYQYQAFGRPTIYTHPGTDGQWLSPDDTTQNSSPAKNPYLSTGRRLDILNSGSLTIQYSRNRYYSPSLGRWYSQDPLGITPNAPYNLFGIETQYYPSINLNEYVRGNPLLSSDPFGLWEVSAKKEVSWSIDVVTGPSSKNYISRQLTAEVSDGPCCTFTGAPTVAGPIKSRVAWSGDLLAERGPTLFHKDCGDDCQCDCYTYFISYKWSQGVPKPSFLPGWLPWPSWWMQTDITLEICADGTSDADSTNTTNRPKWYHAK